MEVAAADPAEAVAAAAVKVKAKAVKAAAKEAAAKGGAIGDDEGEDEEGRSCDDEASEIVQDLDFFAKKPMYRSVRMGLLRDSCPNLVARFEAAPVSSSAAANKKATAGASAAGGGAKMPTPKKPKTPRGWRERSPTQNAITGFMRQRKPGTEDVDAASTPPRVFTPGGGGGGGASAFVDCFSPLSFGSDGSEELMASGLYPIPRPTRRLESSSLGAGAPAAGAVAGAGAVDGDGDRAEEEEEEEKVKEQDEDEKEEAAAAAGAFASPPAPRCATPSSPRRESIEVVDLITPPSSTKRTLFTSGAGAATSAPAPAPAPGLAPAPPTATSVGGRGRGGGRGRPSSTPLPSTPLTSPTKRARQVSIKDFMSPSKKPATPGGDGGGFFGTPGGLVLVSDDSFDSAS